MPKGVFSATGDIDLNGHHIVDWRYLSDIPQGKAVVGQFLAWDGTQWSPTEVLLEDVEYDDTALREHLADYNNPHQVMSAQLSDLGATVLLRSDNDWLLDPPYSNPEYGFPLEFTPTSLDLLLMEEIVTGRKFVVNNGALPISWATTTALGQKANYTHQHYAIDIIPDPGKGLFLTTLGGTNAPEWLPGVGADTQEPSGFVNRTDSQYAVTNNRTFSVEPVVTSFNYYDKGVAYTVTHTDSITFSNAEGVHVFYYAGSTLSTTTVFNAGSMILEGALVSIAYWDATNSTVIYLADERHGIQMDGQTHRWMHVTQGCQYVQGMTLTDILADESGNLDTHATIGVEAGTVADEDIWLDAATQTVPAQIPVFYLDGAAANWRKATTTNFPVRSFGAGDRLAWNELTGGVWQQTEITNADFVLAHIVRTNDPDMPYIAVQGQSDYTKRTDAREGATTEVANLYTIGLPFAEFVFIGTIIYQTRSTYDNAVQARILTTDLGDDYVDWRVQELRPGAGPGDHGSLAGLSDADHPLTALQQSSATTNQVVTWNGATWVPATPYSGATAGTNISTNGSTISVIDSPTFAGTCTADEMVVAVTSSGAHTSYEASLAVTTTAYTANTYTLYNADINKTAGAGAILLDDVAAYNATVVLNDTGSIVVAQSVHLYKGTMDANQVPVDNRPVEFSFTDPATAQTFPEGFFSVTVYGGNTGNNIAAYTRAYSGGGSQSAIGYQGFAAGSVSSTGEVIGVVGYTINGHTFGCVVSIEGSGTGGTTPKDKVMSFRGKGHALIRGGSLVLSTSSTDGCPNSVSTDHLDFVNNSGELYVPGQAEFDDEVFFDGNITYDITIVNSTYTISNKNFIVVDNNTTNMTVTLPSASGIAGRSYRFIRVDTNISTVHLVPDSTAEKINGGARKVMTAGMGFELINAGNNWYTFGEKN